MAQAEVQVQQPHQRTKTRPPIKVTSSTGHQYSSRTADVLAGAFSTDPIFGYMINHIPKKRRHSVRHKIFNCMHALAAYNDAIFYEASSIKQDGLKAGVQQEKEQEPEFQCAAVITRPGKHGDDDGIRGWWELIKGGLLNLVWDVGVTHLPRARNEYTGVVDPVKKAYFGPKNKDYYYVMWVGTDEAHRGKGLCPALLRDLQGRATRDGKPIWLEAATKAARQVYLKCGFEDVGTPLVFGRGRCDGSGEKCKGEGALGVEFYPMAWWPENVDREGWVKERA